MKNILLNIYAFHRNRFIKLLVFLVILYGLSYTRDVVANASNNKYSIPDKYFSKMDHDIKNYIDENIPKNCVWVESNTTNNFNQVSSKKENRSNLYLNSNSGNGNVNISDKIECQVYTFVKKENNEELYYSVVDFYMKEKINTSKNDWLEVAVNDYLMPVSPAKGELLVKNNLNQDWEFQKEPTVIVNGAIQVYGSEMYSRKNFSRMIFSFTSRNNIDSVEKQPHYTIYYLNYKETPFIALSITILLLCFILLSLLILYFKYKKRFR